MTDLTELETPCLLLDLDRLERNLQRMREHCRSKGAQLRPHLKTAKSIDVARLAAAGAPMAVTVSTLQEADHFARAGYRDLLLATPVVPTKLARAARIMAETGADLILATDSAGVAAAAARFAQTQGIRLSLVIEVDCGEHRSGLPAGDVAAIVSLARTIHASPHLRLRGIMTHAGHSYGTDDVAAVAGIARAECGAAAAVATAIRGAGLPCEIVSVGSTPTVLHAPSFAGITEVRCGIYMFWDLSQASRHICGIDDIAVSVLASVISHSQAAPALILDAGRWRSPRTWVPSATCPRRATGSSATRRRQRRCRAWRWRPCTRSTAPYPSATWLGSSACRWAAWCACCPITPASPVRPMRPTRWCAGSRPSPHGRA